MHFDNFGDYESRYSNRYIRLQTDEGIVPARVVEVNYGGDIESVSFVLYGADGENLGEHSVYSEELILDFSGSFFTDSEDGTDLLFWNRTPNRQWSQGFRFGQYRSTPLSKNPTYRENEEVRRIQQALCPKFTSVQEMFDNKGRTSILSRKFAVNEVGEMFYRTRKIGLVSYESRKVLLFKETEYLQDQLQRMGIPFDSCKYKRAQTDATYSFTELLNAGIEPPEVNVDHLRDARPQQGLDEGIARIRRQLNNPLFERL